MTNPTAFGRPAPTVPKGDVLGTYDTYLEAQGVVDHLSKAEFDVAHMSIVGNDLKTVERITGRLTYGRAALAGAASGAWLGLFFGLVLTLFSPLSPQLFGVVGAALLIGAGFGAIFGIVSYAITRRNRDFTSTHQVVASNYQVIIDPEFTARAQAALSAPPAES
ncbi:MAG TPA: general stress protein [Rhodoglobus sp.]|nr:general stress protein [Rhodoglobus sp.]